MTLPYIPTEQCTVVLKNALTLLTPDEPAKPKTNQRQRRTMLRVPVTESSRASVTRFAKIMLLSYLAATSDGEVVVPS